MSCVPVFPDPTRRRYPLSSYVITPVNKSSARQRAGRAKERPMVADRRRRTADAPRAHGKEHRAEEDASTARRGDGGGGGGSSHALTSPSPADRPGSHDDSRRLEYRRPQRQFRDQPRRSRHSPGTETPRHRHSPPPVKRQLDRVKHLFLSFCHQFTYVRFTWNHGYRWETGRVTGTTIIAIEKRF